MWEKIEFIKRIDRRRYGSFLLQSYGRSDGVVEIFVPN